jgi:hypothetical protein
MELMDQSRQRITGEDLEEGVAMLSGLWGATYEDKLVELGLKILEERWHQADMVQVYKILTGKDWVQRESWFKTAIGGAARTGQATDLMNIVKPRTRLEVGT